MERRKFLAVAAASGTVGLAGCNSSSGPKPASLESPEVTVSEEVSYGDDATLTVSVANSGGEDGTFTATLHSTSEAVEYEDDIELTVPGGESAETESDPISFPSAGEYTFELEGPSLTDTPTEDGEPEDGEPETTTLASTTVSVTTDSKAGGETVQFSDNLLLTVDSVEFLQNVFTGGDDPTGVFTAPTGKILALYHVSLENVGTSNATWNPARVNADGGEFYGQNAPPVSNAGESLGTRRDLSPSETVSGHLVAQFPTDAVRTTAPISVQVDEVNTTPEYRWDFATSTDRTFPEFALQSVDAPRSTPSGEPYDITLTLANNGDGAGTVKGVLQYTEDGDADWSKLESAETPVVEKEIAAGESVDVTVTNQPNTFGGRTFEYRLAPFENQTWETHVS